MPTDMGLLQMVICDIGLEAYLDYRIIGSSDLAKHGTGIPGLNFSLRRALGVSSAQAKLSRAIGVPLSRSGRQRKIARGMGCCWVVLLVSAGYWITLVF
jgi:hypothetical protein